MMFGLALLLGVALAGEATPDQARELAQLYYTLTDQSQPVEAFLQDDIAALLDSGRDAGELEQAVRWIAKEVPGADRYTLGAILESHLATALGEEEDIVIPDTEPVQVLAEQERAPTWQPSAAVVQDLLVDFYDRTGRVAPRPATEDDLRAFKLLAREGWTELGVRLLVDWVPDNVRGVEQLAFADIARVAVEKGYNGGPQPSGRLEELRGVQDWSRPESWVVPRDPERFAGGAVRGLVSMGALPAVTDEAMHAARLPGSELRIVEASVRLDAGAASPGVTALVGQATPRYGFVVEALVQDHTPGTLDADRLAYDGGPPRQLSVVRERVGGGRFSVGVRDKMAVGVHGYATVGAGQAEAGGTASMGFGQPERGALVQVGLASVRKELGGEPTQGDVLSAELLPSLEVGGLQFEGRGRAAWSSGGLQYDEFPILADRYSQIDTLVELRVGQDRQQWQWGLTGSWQRGLWELGWKQDGVETLQRVSGSELEVASGAAFAPRRVWKVYGGSRLVLGLGEEARSGLEAALGGSWLVGDKVWLSGGLRGGPWVELDGSVVPGASAQLAVSLPY